MQTLATYKYNGEPGVVASTYGSGKVVLFGPHAEIEEDSNRDGTSFGKSLDDNDSDWRMMQYVLSWLGASSSSSVSGDYSRYDFTFNYNSGSGDYYTGYVYAPTSFETSQGGFLSVGTYLYLQPQALWASGYHSLNGGYYCITSITDGYDSGYDKQSYITSYYDASAQSTLEVNTSTSLLSYVNGHIHVSDRTLNYESGYAISGSQHDTFSVYKEANVTLSASAPPSPVASSPATLTYATSQAVWAAYWSQADSLTEKEK